MRLPGIPDEVERVRELKELRAGLVVWELNCDNCGSAHRYMIINPDLGDENEPCWTFEPIPACADPWVLELVGPQTVESGDLYRVVDPALASTQTTAARKRQPVRT